jgi:hypothetical protein
MRLTKKPMHIFAVWGSYCGITIPFMHSYLLKSPQRKQSIEKTPDTVVVTKGNNKRVNFSLHLIKHRTMET